MSTRTVESSAMYFKDYTESDYARWIHKFEKKEGHVSKFPSLPNNRGHAARKGGIMAFVLEKPFIGYLGLAERAGTSAQIVAHTVARGVFKKWVKRVTNVRPFHYVITESGQAEYAKRVGRG